MVLIELIILNRGALLINWDMTKWSLNRGALLIEVKCINWDKWSLNSSIVVKSIGKTTIVKGAGT